MGPYILKHFLNQIIYGERSPTLQKISSLTLGGTTEKETILPELTLLLIS